MKFFIISTFILIAIVVLDLIYDEYFWSQNILITKYLQEHTFVGEYYLFKFFSLIIQLPIILGTLHFMLSSKKIEAILYIFMCIIGFVTNGLLKNAYHQPRPYWVEDDIEGLGCNMEFGKPSGHAETSVIIYFSYLFIFYPATFKFNNPRVIESGDQQSLETKEKEISNGIVALLILFAFLAMLMTGLSRVFLGVHTFSQVILGWVFGMYITLNYQMYCHKFLYQYFQFQLQQIGEDVVKFQRLSVSVAGLFVFIIALDVLLLELNQSVFNQDEEEVQRWLLKIDECKKKELGHYTIRNTNVLYNACFIHGTLFSVIFGLIQGCFFGQGSFNQNEFSTAMDQKTIKFHLCRLLLYIPMFIPLPLLLIQTEMIYLTAFLIFMPIILFECWYLTIIYPSLLHQWKLQVKGDFLEYRIGQYEQLSQS